MPGYKSRLAKADSGNIPVFVSDEARGLGAMESNEDKLFADRKKKGLSWTIAGARRMGKAIQLVANGELRNWCGRKPSEPGIDKDPLSFDVFCYPLTPPYLISPTKLVQIPLLITDY